jgi:formylglycine-generating enzyme required for sulfatase activity
LFKSNLIPYLFYLLAFSLGLYACGSDDSYNIENKISTTGTYQPTLIFPDHIPRKESFADAITGINCEANQISTIEFSFIMNDSSHGPHSFACRDHQAYIQDIPAGTDIQVDVYAYNENHAPVLYGFETTAIHAGQVTQGGEIEMKPVDDNQARDEDGDGFTPPDDCDDTNADINPDAAEIPDNNIDENCDGQTEVSSFTLTDLDMEFVRIPAGEFDMGSPLNEPGHQDDENLHRVRLTQNFYLQTTEVTQRQWRTVVNTAASTTLDPNPSDFINCGDDCPVDSVSWNDIQQLIIALNIIYEETYEFRLPTEAQWEYAARAESSTGFANGPITEIDCGLDPVLDAMGWYCGNSDVNYEGCYDDSETEGPTCAGPHPVAEKNPNAWGLYDMHGNVWERCQDWYEETYSYTTTGPVIDPQGPSSGTQHVIRGGSWLNPARVCRSALRIPSGEDPNSGGNAVGFRLVCSPLNN